MDGQPPARSSLEKADLTMSRSQLQTSKGSSMPTARTGHEARPLQSRHHSPKLWPRGLPDVCHAPTPTPLPSPGPALTSAPQLPPLPALKGPPLQDPRWTEKSHRSPPVPGKTSVLMWKVPVIC